MTEDFERRKMSPAQEIVYKNKVQKIMNGHYGKTNNNKNSCPGYVNVSSYTRAGKEVSGYTRNCPYH